MSRTRGIFLGVCLLLAGCAKTTVVLLPDETGAVGEVVVRAAGEEKKLDVAEQRVDAGTGGLSPVTRMPPGDMEQTFGTTLRALPVKPESLLVYFDAESVHPTAASVRELPRAARIIGARAVPSVEVFGHTDHMGDPAYNQALSDRRAAEVRRLLIRQGVSSEIIHERGFGYRDPLVPPKPGRPEPRNRRVEIFIR